MGFLNVPINTILKHIFYLYSYNTLLSKHEVIDRMDIFMGGKGIKDLKFKHPNDPHGHRIYILVCEPS
jgi:hypothetical protein